VANQNNLFTFLQLREVLMPTLSKLLLSTLVFCSGQQALAEAPAIGSARSEVAECNRTLLIGLAQTEEGSAFLKAIESKLGKDWLNRFPYLKTTQLEQERERITTNIDYILPEDLKALHSPIAWGCDTQGRPFIAIVYDKLALSTGDATGVPAILISTEEEVFYQLHPENEQMAGAPLWRGWVALGYKSVARDIGPGGYMTLVDFVNLATLITDGTILLPGGRLALAYFS
jgi:hypothetical protein